MLIEGKDYKINVLILLMPGEVDVTIQTVETLLESIEEGVTISILMNGSRNPELKGIFSSHNSVRYYESVDNLGVAGGRNYLLQTEESKNADIIMVLDNDVVPPLDYIRRLSTFLLKQKDAGITGAVVADIRFGVKLNIVKKYGETGVFGNKIFKIQSSHVKEDILDNLSPKKLFHIGTHPDYYYAYFSLRPLFYSIMRRYLNIFRIRICINSNPFLIYNKSYLEQIEQGIEKYPVSNVAGCSQAFRRELVEEIGYFDNRFNPYGFEDVDFCIRASKAGYKNYIDTNTWIFHGTDIRHKKRDVYKMLANQFRCRTILASLVLSNPTTYKFVILKLIFAGFLLEFIMFRFKAVYRFRARLKGYKKGLEIIREKSPKKNPDS